jgi:integrase/recombinase XerD
MLQDLFPRTSQRYRNLPILGPILNDLDDWLITRGYQPYTRRKHSRCMVSVDAYFQRQGRNTIEAITPEDLQACWQWYNQHRVHDASTVRVLHHYLDDQGCIPAPSPPLSPRYGEYVERYLQYLKTVRGLAPPTIDQHQLTATKFVEYLATQQAEFRLADLTATMMEQFITCCGHRLSRATLQHVVARVRGFVRFLALIGEVAPGMERHLDMPRLYRFEQLPRALPWETVCQLLASIDRTMPIGRRDYAMLLSIATYGLRNCDIVALTLDDIQWRHETLHLTQHKTGQPLVLPLTDAMGTALLDYLQHGRPTSSYRSVFLRARAPIGPLERTAVTDVFQAWAARSGLAIPFQGAHCLRHAYAIHLLRQGVSLQVIGDVLGHRTMESTYGYLRFALEDLREVALPVPSEEETS